MRTKGYDIVPGFAANITQRPETKFLDSFVWYVAQLHLCLTPVATGNRCLLIVSPFFARWSLLQPSLPGTLVPRTLLTIGGCARGERLHDSTRVCITADWRGKPCSPCTRSWFILLGSPISHGLLPSSRMRLSKWAVLEANAGCSGDAGFVATLPHLLLR